MEPTANYLLDPVSLPEGTPPLPACSSTPPPGLGQPLNEAIDTRPDGTVDYFVAQNSHACWPTPPPMNAIAPIPAFESSIPRLAPPCGEPRPTQESVMLVDDAPANLKLLEEILIGAGYRVRSFPLGRLALNAAPMDPPDIILLDVSMPEIDGYEVCARLKSNPALAHIPVLFISALTEPIDKTRAFGCGGVDYITKPFHFEEVLARVRTHLNIRKLQQEIERRNSGLEKLADLHTRQLSEANARLAVLDEAKTEFLRRIALELRTPLDGLFGIVSQLLADPAPPTLDRTAQVGHFLEAQQRLQSLCEDAVLLSQSEILDLPFPPQRIPLRLLLQIAESKARATCLPLGVSLGSAPDDPRQVEGDTRLLPHAFRALLEIAARLSAPGETVRLTTSPRDGSTPAVRIDALGCEAPAETLPAFLDHLAHSQDASRRSYVGLSPEVAQRIFTLFGCRLSVENLLPPGIRFTVTFPDSEPAAPSA